MFTLLQVDKMMDGKTQNFNHELQDWRTRCGKEVLLKTQWMGAWGDGPWGTGLKDKTTPEELAQISRGLGPCQAYVSKMYEEEKSKTGSKSKTFAPGHGVSKFAARKMIPQNFSEVGTTLYTSGVDPAVKYNHPQTTSSVHGWEGAEPMENMVLWDHKHGKKGLQLDHVPPKYPPLNPQTEREKKILKSITENQVIYSHRLF